MPEKPLLRMEINNSASVCTVFISPLYLSLLTLDYCINVLQEHLQTLCEEI